MDIQNFITQFKKTFIYDMLKDYVSDEKLFDYVVDGTNVIWMKEQTRQMWSMWQAAKADAVPDGFVLVEKNLIKTLHEELLDHEPDSFVVNRDICELWKQANGVVSIQLLIDGKPIVIEAVV